MAIQISIPVNVDIPWTDIATICVTAIAAAATIAAVGIAIWLGAGTRKTDDSPTVSVVEFRHLRYLCGPADLTTE